MSAEIPSGGLEQKAGKTIKDYRMISQGDELAAGVSGGADSVSLLHFLLSIRQESGIGVTAVHVNHNLRGDESRRDEDFVRALCESLNVPLIVESVDIAAISKASGKSTEECARDERYRVLKSAAAKMNAKIATAHTLNDSAETLLFNLSRGTGTRGLAGIPPVRDNIIRPLISCSRSDVEDYCRRHSLSWVTDGSNLSDDYTRNRIRRRVVPALEEINPAFLANASRAMELLRADSEYLDREAGILFERLSSPAGLDRNRLLGLPAPMLSRIMLLLCAGNGVSPERARVDMMTDALASGGRLQLSSSKTLVCRGNAVYLEDAEEEIPYFEKLIDVASLPDFGRFEPYKGKIVNLTRVNREKLEYYAKTDINLLKNAFDCDKMGKIIKLRQRLPADYIRLKGRGCSKTLKKLFNEAKIPSLRRNRLVTVSGEAEELLWVEGFGVSEACAADGETKSILIISTE